MATVTGTVNDPLGRSDADTQTVVTAGGAPGITTIRRSAMQNRVIWTSPTPGFESDDQPQLVPDNINVGPLASPTTMGLRFTLHRDCRIVGARVYQAPVFGGSVPIGVFSSGGVLLSTGTLTFTAGEQGWVEGNFDTPINANDGDSLAVGYLLPSGADYAWTVWQWYAQNWVGWPFEMVTGASIFGTGSGLTYTEPTGNLKNMGYWIDPIAEWDVDTPRYVSGTSYYSQWETAGSRHAFPVGVFYCDPPAIAEYYAMGINTLIGGYFIDEYITIMKSIANMDWYPTNNDYFSVDAPTLVQIDPELQPIVRGYYMIDEPDINQPYKAPEVLLPWRNDMRKIDSSRPILLGFSFNVFRNQGYFNLPVGAPPIVWNTAWREFAALADATAGDWFTLSANDTYAPVGEEFQGIGPTRFGIWGYAEQVPRLKQLHDNKIPTFAYVETTAEVPNLPSPSDVVKATWAHLIAGAAGIIFFDHRFGNQVVNQDFSAMLHDPPMKAAVTTLIAKMQTLAPALLAPPQTIIESYVSSGTMAVSKGGLAAGHRIPIHHSERRASGTTYLFCQSIRPGATTVTFYVPSLAGATLTVIDESRTVTIDGGGHFTETFAADYTVHLYSTTTAPSFSAPANTVAPVVTTDGTPQQGEAITVSKGTWTGVPIPTFTYKWQRNGTNITGATGSGYTLTPADVGQSIRCVVTATNIQGSASANSNAITPAGPTGSGNFSRSFSGSDTIQLGGGTLGAVFNGAHTIIAVVKPNTITGSQNIVSFGSTSSSWGNLAYVGGVMWYYTPTEARAGAAVVTAGEWQILAFTKAAGTIEPRWHRVAIDVGTWSHGVLSGPVTDKATPVTKAVMSGFIEGTGNVDGRIATIGLINSELSDAQVAGILTAKSTQHIKDLGAVGLWDINQGDVTVSIDDLIGTADQTSRSGTTVVADKPTGWVYGAI